MGRKVIGLSKKANAGLRDLGRRGPSLLAIYLSITKKMRLSQKKLKKEPLFVGRLIFLGASQFFLAVDC